MIVDAQNQLSLKQSATTGTQVSQNAIDLTQVGRDVSRNGKLRLVITIDTAYAAGTSLDFQLIGSAAANLGSPTVLYDSLAIPVANLTKGAKVVDVLLPPTPLEFLGVQTIAVGTFTGGAHTASIVIDTDQNKFYTSVTGY